LAVKGIDIGAGVVDSSYRGEIKVLVINNSGSDFMIESGSKIAQLILERCSDSQIEVVDILSETERGYGGFGSTGTK
jgi:dUTP pyrophosphatase